MKGSKKGEPWILTVGETARGYSSSACFIEDQTGGSAGELS